MSLSSSKMPRPVCFCLVLSLIMLLVPAMLIPFWVNKVKRIEGDIKEYASTNQENGLLNHFHITMKFGFMLMILMMVTMAISIVSFVILTIRPGNRELIKQNEATQQEEMRSLNKSTAFVEANHDLRVALASISGLIALCRSTQASQLLVDYLNMMESCMNDLLEFRDKILPTIIEEVKEEPIEQPKVDSAYHLRRQKDVLVDVNESSSENLPLTGKKILVIEDDTTSLTISKRMVSKLGATIYTSINGKKVVEYVCKILRDQRDIGPSTPSPPFDFILIDCEMVKICAFATTICTRKQLSYYGFQIPFIGLTAHSKVEVLAKIAQAEMDFYLPKPLKPDLLLTAIDYLENRKV